MLLYKIKDFDPHYRDTFGGYDIKGLEVYSGINNEKIGKISDLMVDEAGHFRYFIVDLGFWGFGKNVMMPVGQTQIDPEGRFVRALGFTKERAEQLPEFNESLKVDRNYEEKVRGVYQPTVAPTQRSVHPVESAGPLESSVPLEAYPPQTVSHPAAPGVGQPGYLDQAAAPYPPVNSSGYAPTPVPQSNYPGTDPMQYYQQNPELYGMNAQNHSILQRFEQRLIEKKRQVSQGK
uniref:PRC-barrel domain protein n=1 Tax=Cyanothece sp. (strain PCC 7425 / ATCC 29141) TaxID=395961 RepID=B8HWL7_CYAP4